MNDDAEQNWYSSDEDDATKNGGSKREPKPAALIPNEPVDVDMRQSSSAPRDPRRAVALKKETDAASLSRPADVEKEIESTGTEKDLFGSINIQDLVSKLKSEVRGKLTVPVEGTSGFENKLIFIDCQ